MTRVVWKYPFGEGGEFRIRMPLGAKILHVDTQGRQPCMWALVDPEAPVVPRGFVLLGTGHVINDFSPAWTFVGTFLADDGRFVFHLWDCGDGS